MSEVTSYHLKSTNDIEARLNTLLPLFQRIIQVSKNSTVLAPSELLDRFSECIYNLRKDLIKADSEIRSKFVMQLLNQGYLDQFCFILHKYCQPEGALVENLTRHEELREAFKLFYRVCQMLMSLSDVDSEAVAALI